MVKNLARTCKEKADGLLDAFGEHLSYQDALPQLVGLMEYTIVGFIPVIIASVLGSTISQLAFGSEGLILVPPVELNLLWEMPFMVCAGLLYTIAAVSFIRLHLYASRWRDSHALVRYLVIGLLTGGVAIFLPQIPGSGYDTVNEFFAEQLVNGAAGWIVIREEGVDPRLISTADLAKHLEKLTSTEPKAEQMIDLNSIAARVFKTTTLDSRSNLYEASQAIQQDDIEAVCVTLGYGRSSSIVGILTRDAIRKFYGI